MIETAVVALFYFLGITSLLLLLLSWDVELNPGPTAVEGGKSQATEGLSSITDLIVQLVNKFKTFSEQALPI